MAMGIYALVVSLVWIFPPDKMFVSDFVAYTGQSLSDAVASGFKPAEFRAAIGRQDLPRHASPWPGAGAAAIDPAERRHPTENA